MLARSPCVALSNEMRGSIRFGPHEVLFQFKEPLISNGVYGFGTFRGSVHFPFVVAVASMSMSGVQVCGFGNGAFDPSCKDDGNVGLA